MMLAFHGRGGFPGRPAALALSALCMTMILGSCSRLLGWGVLLWSSENPPVPSGTVLPVYIRSNIDEVWVVGIPEKFRRPGDVLDKFEIPLAQLELAKSKKKAEEQARAFSSLALSYAETLQDGLPIREAPDNSSRRVYRLRLGEIIKILERVDGSPAMGGAGTPLPGDWYRVLTEDGSRGYCFSYRLRIFEHSGGVLTAIRTTPENEEDPDLERLLTRVWSPDWYGTMVNNRQIDLEDLSRHWCFSPGIDTGLARIYLPNLDRTFTYTGIRSAGTRTWRFEGTTLRMSLLSDSSLSVEWNDPGAALRTLRFVALPQDVEDLIMQETARRDGLYDQLYGQGPVFNSTNYGALVFSEDGRFSWTGYDFLVPRIIPSSVSGSGQAAIDLFLDPTLQSLYDGALSLRFDGIGSAGATLRFMYTLDTQGLRLEYAPPVNVEGVIVKRRAASPTVIYFFRAEQTLPGSSAPWTSPGLPSAPEPSPAPQVRTPSREEWLPPEFRDPEEGRAAPGPDDFSREAPGIPPDSAPGF